ncbi:MAG: protein kinase [Cyanobacteria bacterium P01_F01_bin.150]
MNTLTELKAGLNSGQLAGQTRINLSCGLTEFPLELLDLADSLEILDLSNNQLTHLPEEFGQFKALRIAFFNNNQFEEFPAVLKQCPNLSMISFKGNAIHTVGDDVLSPNIRWLILTNNQLTHLPASIGQLSRLQKLMLAGNQLEVLPDELGHCKNLELMRIAANQLKVPPDWLFSLPRLTWLAYSGNPFCEIDPRYDAASIKASASDLRAIAPTELEYGDVLGQGASGVIYKGHWHKAAANSPKDVAIKLFKGEITSDGSPLDEMQACIAAGTHPNLVNVLGRYEKHDQKGLVFSFIPPEYENLGGPPSLDSCTRDTYSEETTFTLPVILRIARGIASVVAHLHERGIMHGDVYAHNILVNDRGDCIFGDFGAASFYNRSDEAIASGLEKMESRAFGCLLEDLLDRHISDTKGNDSSEDHDGATIDQLRQLQQNCMSPDPILRPLFPDICKTLASL